ncbi:hypothetical protein SCHAM137S_01910 [Streptomyces chartreusis]
MSGICCAAVPKIWPIGASLKYSEVTFLTSSRSSEVREEGKLPSFSKMWACCSGAVSHATSFCASALTGLFSTTPRKEPPQLAPLGALATSHLPAFSGPAFSLMWLSIHAGQTAVANVPLASPGSQPGWN